MKPQLKAPGTKRLRLKYDNLLPGFAFNFNLRCYSQCASVLATMARWFPKDNAVERLERDPGIVLRAGEQDQPLVGRSRLTR